MPAGRRPRSVDAVRGRRRTSSASCPRRSRSPGSCARRRPRRRHRWSRSSAHARRSSSRTTWRPRRSSSSPRRWSGWTASARPRSACPMRPPVACRTGWRSSRRRGGVAFARMTKVIRGGRVVTATDQFDADVLIDGESVVAVGTDLQGDDVIDATGCLVLPGLIDNHTHLAMPFGGTWSCDDYDTGTAAAAARRDDVHRRLLHPVRRRLAQGRARRVARARGRRGAHRLRLPHGDHRRAARGGRRDGAVRRRGRELLQGLHGLQGRADGRRRAVPRRARADRQDRRAGDGALRERRRGRALPEGGARGRPHGAEVPRADAPAGGRGRGHEPRDPARRVGRSGRCSSSTSPARRRSRRSRRRATAACRSTARPASSTCS